MLLACSAGSARPPLPLRAAATSATGATGSERPPPLRVAAALSATVAAG